MLNRRFHVRMMLTIVLLTLSDVLGLFFCVKDVIKSGPSMSILFGNEFALLFVCLASIIVRYILNTGDHQRGAAWEHRSIFLFYFEFIVDLLKLIIYSSFFGIVVTYYGVPLHIIRDLYMTVRSFIVRVRDIIRYRQATTNMNERYPEATPEELSATDHVCIICREEMLTARKLPCGHLFHFRCLRSWLERQQACPTCRRPILENSIGDTGNVPIENLHPPLENARGVPVEDELHNEQQQQAQRRRMVWRNGRWIHENEQTPQPLEGHRLVEENGEDEQQGERPALIFPHIPPASPFPPASPIATMGHIPGTVIPNPFGTIPIILIPPEQIAVVRPPRQVPPRPTARTPDPVGNAQRVPNRPHSASPLFSPASDDLESKELPIYKLTSDQLDQPILLEPLGGSSGFPATLEHTDQVLTSNVGTSANIRHPNNVIEPTDEIVLSRRKIKTRLKKELELLTKLQSDVATLTERIIIAIDKIEQDDAT